jgi:hypothetical protein
MRTFAQRHNQSQYQISSNLFGSNMAPFARSRQAPAVTHLPRTVNSQAERGLPSRSSKSPEPVADIAAALDFSRIPIHGKAPVMLQTKCACGSRCPKCHIEKQSCEHMQTKPVQASDAGKSVAPTIVHEALHSRGQQLDTSTREFMESRFDHDFSRVRVHTDSTAIEATQSVNALAFTVGQDIAFGRDKYSPQSPSGRELLAHELVHVMQQNSSPSLLGIPLALSEPGDELEREADRVAKDVLPPSSGVRQLAEPHVQRVPSNQSQSPITQRPTN